MNIISLEVTSNMAVVLISEAEKLYYLLIHGPEIRRWKIHIFCTRNFCTMLKNNMAAKLNLHILFELILITK